MKALPVVKPVELPLAAPADATKRFAVSRVFCVGRNYADHAVEMGASGREPPFFFMKPAQSLFLVSGGQAQWPYPMATEDCHHEVELVVAMASGGANLTVEQAQAAIWGYAVGLDMTRRDRQAQMKKEGKSWEIGKAFDASAPITPLVPLESVPDLLQQGIRLTVNGEVRQQGQFDQMIWSVAETIAELSKAWSILPGDLIYTGTPAGVGPVVRGDVLQASVPGLPTLDLKVA
jgi:fumarylpyruvate hydrolase